jgi:DNA invertase Pin-like site-specific DNA recombinase
MSPAHRAKFVSYLRVSTDKQGKSGLGIEAQREAVKRRLDGGSWKLIAEYVETESGRRSQRPQLEAALAHCRKHKAKLVVAKLDRLTRNVRFLLTLIDSRVEVLFGDVPHAPGATGRFMLTQMAAVAELEAGLISERTKAALQAARARGQRLGVTGAGLAARWKAEADQRAQRLAPIMRDMQRLGLSLNAMAAELTKWKIKTPRGGRWSAQTVKRVCERLPAH